jgi:hypothetical protein
MIQIGTGQAQCAFLPHESDPSLGAKIFTTLTADGFAVRDENLDLLLPFALHCPNLLDRFHWMLLSSYLTRKS